MLRLTAAMSDLANILKDFGAKISCCINNGLKNIDKDVSRNAGEGGAGGQAPLLPFAKGGKGGKSALFMKNDKLL